MAGTALTKGDSKRNNNGRLPAVKEEPVDLSQKTWLTLEETAKYFGTTVGTLHKWLQKKVLNKKNGAHKIRRRWLINRAEFEQNFLDQGDEEE